MKQNDNRLPFLTGRAALAALRKKDISAVDLTTACLDRIAAIDPQIGAFREVVINRALADARRVDDLAAAGLTAGPLAGLPIAIKENIDTVPAACSAGLDFRKDHRPDADAVMAARLRSSGAIVLGVTVSDPGAFGVKTAAVVHLHDPRLTVGGSSGGSAAAIAAGMCYAALGTDTGGSIRIPSACCGTVGLKPTRGRLSLEGVFPLVESLDHIGPMAANAGDIVPIFAALDQQPTPDTPAEITVIGYDPVYFADAESSVQNDFANLIDLCRQAGILCREIQLPRPDDASEVHSSIFSIEAAALHLARFGDHEASYPRLGRETFKHANSMTAQAYISACVRRGRFTRQVSALFDDVQLILTPTLAMREPEKCPEGFEIGGKWIDYTFALVRYTCLFNHTGHPTLAMPMSAAGAGTPASVQVVGPLDADWAVISFAARLERQIEVARFV